MPTYINNVCSAPYSLTGASGYKPLLTLEDIAAAIQELTDLQSQLQCCTQTEKDAEAIVFTATPSGTAPNYDWSCEIRLNTCFFAGDVLTVDLTGIPNNFTLDSISPITPATVLINVVAKTLVFTGTVLAGTYFVISGTFDDNICVAGTATLTIAGDTITANNVVTGTYSGATWCVPPVPPTTTINPTVATLIAPNNNDGGCVGGFISETVTITGGGLNVPVSSFPADLCALLSGLPVTLGTNLLTITSDVATACGTATHAIGITVSEVGGFITQINGTSCTPPPLKDTLVDTDNNANGFGCNAGVLVYPFSIDLTARGGAKVAVTSDADIISAYAALPIPITVTISGCDILLPLGETPTDIEVGPLYDCFAQPISLVGIYRNIVVNGVTYSTGTHPGTTSGMTSLAAEINTLGIPGLIWAGFIPKIMHISFQDNAAVSVSIERSIDGGITWSQMPSIQYGDSQPNPCVS